MIREYLSRLHWSVLPVVSMFIFLTIFVGVMIWVYRKDSTRIYKTMENLPNE